MSRRLVLALAVLLTVLALPAPAFAHATLVRSFPAYGQALDNAPSTVELEFNEPVSAAFTPVTVRNDRGERVDAGDGAVDPASHNLVTGSLKSPLPAGLYTVVYRVTSLDGHPVEGTIAFTVGEAPAVNQAAPTASGTPPAVSVAHGAAQLLACLLAGLTAFLVLVSAGLPRPGRLAAALTALFLAATLAEVSLYAVRASGEPWSFPLLQQALLRTRVGSLALVRMGLAIAAGAALGLLPPPGPSSRLRWLAPLPGLGLLLAFSLQSHAAATGRTLPVAMDFAHLVAIAPWVGGLAGFAIQPRPDLVPRFSRIAMVSVLILTGTGLYGARLHLPTVDALWATAYGRALLWKLGLLLPVLGLAAYNLLRKGQGLFRLTVRGELALVFGIFLAAGFLSSLPPAPVELALKQGPFSEAIHVHSQGLTYTLTITPNRLGFNQATFTIVDMDGKPETGAHAGLRLTMLDHDMGMQTADARETAPGTYQVRDIVLGMPGQWRAEIVALTKGGQELRQPFQVNVPSPP